MVQMLPIEKLFFNTNGLLRIYLFWMKTFVVFDSPHLPALKISFTDLVLPDEKTYTLDSVLHIYFPDSPWDNVN